MKISIVESGKALANTGAAEAKILPKDRPRGHSSLRDKPGRKLSPLEQGMAVAESALAEVPDIREDLVNDLKDRIARGDYTISGKDVADMIDRKSVV